MASSRRSSDTAFYALLAITALSVLVEVYFIFLVAPIEARMGVVQKIFYFHVPSWYAMYIGAGACFLGSLGYLVRAADVRDAFARAGAEVAVVFGAIGLITGAALGCQGVGVVLDLGPEANHSSPQLPHLCGLPRPPRLLG